MKCPHCQKEMSYYAPNWKCNSCGTIINVVGQEKHPKKGKYHALWTLLTWLLLKLKRYEWKTIKRFTW